MNAKELFSTPIDELTFSVVDTETTGMHSRFCRVMDIGIVKIKNGQIIEEWETLIDPQQRIPFWITFYTHLRSKDVKGQPPFEHFAKTIKEKLQNTIFVAHNVGFDYPFLFEEFKRCEMLFDNPKLCTVKLARQLVPNLPSANLDTVSDFYNLKIEHRHRALPDAKATALILLEFIKLAKEKHQAKTFYDLERIQFNKRGLQSFRENLFTQGYATEQ